MKLWISIFWGGEMFAVWRQNDTDHVRRVKACSGELGIYSILGSSAEGEWRVRVGFHRASSRVTFASSR